MRTRRQSIMVLMVLLMPALLWSAQESRAGRRRAESQAASPDTAPDNAREIRVFSLRYQEAEGLARIIMAVIPVNEATIAVDGVSQKLIVAAAPDRLEQIERLIRELDVAPADELDAQQVMYRVYMLEIPPKAQNLKPFAIVLAATEPPSSLQIMDAIRGEDLQIARLFQSSEWTPDGEPRIVIQGRAASREVVERIANAIPNSTITELKWSDEAFIANVPAAQLTQLPQQLQEHIRKFLGPEIGTVGYWFGNVSFPGEAEAPIGPWMLKLETTLQGTDLHLEIEVRQEPTVDIVPSTLILSNSVQGKVGKPILIGYSRDCYGIRTMGAMVILLEEDTM